MVDCNYFVFFEWTVFLCKYEKYKYEDRGFIKVTRG